MLMFFIDFLNIKKRAYYIVEIFIYFKYKVPISLWAYYNV